MTATIDAVVLIALTSSPSYRGVVRVLVVEDELRMAALLKRGLQEDGYAVDVASTGPDAAGGRGRLRRRSARSDAAGDGWRRGLPAAPWGGPLGSGADADRPGRGRGPGAGPGRGRRRLPGQAVQLRRALGPGAGDDPSWGGRAADRAAGRRPAAGTGHPAGVAG